VYRHGRRICGARRFDPANDRGDTVQAAVLPEARV